MSQAGSEPEWDVYTGLLFVAAASMVIGCVLLTLELAKYGFSTGA